MNINKRWEDANKCRLVSSLIKIRCATHDYWTYKLSKREQFGFSSSSSTYLCRLYHGSSNRMGQKCILFFTSAAGMQYKSIMQGMQSSEWLRVETSFKAIEIRWGYHVSIASHAHT